MTQHAELRAMIERCEGLADDVDRGDSAPASLTSAIARLRAAFDAHNRWEERFLRTLHADRSALTEVRLDRMVLDHVEEHRVMRGGLVANVVDELRMTLVRLRSHLAAEERCFLQPGVNAGD